MATEEAKFFFFSSFVALLTICSGTHVGFSYDARRNRGNSSLEETISFLWKNQVPSSLMKASVADRSVLLPLANTCNGIEVHLYVNETSNVENLSALKDETSAITWLKTNLVTYLPRVNITTIIFRVGKSVPGRPPLLLSALTSMHSALKTLNLDHRVNISVSFSLSNLQKSDKKQNKYVHRAVDFVRKWGSFVSIEADNEGELSLGDQFIRLVMEQAVSAASLLPFRDVPLVLNVRSSVYPSAKELSGFNKKMKKLVERNTRTANRFSWLFVEMSPMAEFEQKEFNREKEQMFPSLRRQLARSSHTSVHEITDPPTTFIPATPITTPVTTPVTIPTGPFVNVPSNSPVTVLPTNPVTTPITIPPTFPVPPAAIPVTNPVTAPPITNPNPGTTPVTVPETPPSTGPPETPPLTGPPETPPLTGPPETPPLTGPPETPPVTNPVTTYPFPPPGGTPVVTPVTTPVTFPGPAPGTTVSPVVSGQSWCVAKTGAMEAALQMALDYACGIGGADCSSIQQGGPCYNPNSVRDHASYAFNSYYQKNPTPTSCDFGGAAMVTNINPSSGSCVYPSSSGSPGSPSSVLNTNNFTTTSIFGSTPPGVTTSNSASSIFRSMSLLALGTLATILMNEQHFICSILY
ncbi:hypothetical protein H6P81_004447 [Aristolochia fimbriata]|uniref:X8 domain-containing protein n=1 Tax=Aristolochia fimbriata TaxID=158543 RepID=A0AAV7FH06_ARIFI|nr:hypothetical protein H6P81_004447 [Aristolochia fimbriata]